MIDVCHYVAALESWEKADESRDAILKTGERGVIPVELSRRIAGVAGLRNILVHAYLRVDRSIVYDYLSRLEDFREFGREIERAVAAWDGA